MFDGQRTEVTPADVVVPPGGRGRGEAAAGGVEVGQAEEERSVQSSGSRPPYQ